MENANRSAAVITIECSLLKFLCWQIGFIVCDAELTYTERKLLSYLFLHPAAKDEKTAAQSAQTAVMNFYLDGHSKSVQSIMQYLVNLEKIGLVVSQKANRRRTYELLPSLNDSLTTDFDALSVQFRHNEN